MVQYPQFVNVLTKAIIILMAYLFLPSTLQAQLFKASSSRRAETYLREGKLDFAKKEIETLIGSGVDTLDEKISGKHYLIQGKIYQAIATTEDTAFQSLLEKPVAAAMRALNHAIAVESESSVYAVFAKQQIEQLYAQLYNKGVDAYNANQKKQALAHFEDLLTVAPKDTVALVNLVYSAFDIGAKEKTKKYARQLLNQGSTAPYLYRMLATYAMQEQKIGQALEIVRSGIIRNPADRELKVQLANIYMTNGDYNEAIVEISQLLLLTPENVEMNFKLGLLYDHAGEKKYAIQKYERTISLDSAHYEAHYSLGALYYNQAAELNQSLDELAVDNRGRYLNAEKANEMEREAAELYEKAIPYFKKAFQLRPEETGNLQLLAKMYELLDRKKEYNQAREMLENPEKR